MFRNQIIPILITIIMVFALASPAFAAETAQTVKLEKTEGAVSITKNTDKPVSLREGMKLYNGYIVTTDAESYAWVSLDDTKLVKLDASSSAEIRKNGSLFEVNVINGSAFFDVSEKLGNDESLNIRTSTMAVGIRGTSGWVNARDSYNSDIVILEGTSLCAVSDPVTNQVKSAVLNSGDAAVCVVYPADKQGDKCDILLGEVKTQDIPGYVLVELVSRIELCEKILEASGLDILADLAKSAGGDPTGREADGSSATQEVLREAESIKKAAEYETALMQQEIDEIISRAENNASQTNVWGGETQPSSSSANTNSTQTEAALLVPALPQSAATGYTITLDANGGTVSTPQITTDESGVLTSLPTPTREHCTFLGWYTAPTGGSQITAPYTFSQDTILYAMWKGWRREGNTVYIFGPGAMDEYSPAAPWGTDINAAVIEDGVTNISNNAFLNCNSLTNITLASSVESIGDNAFYGCSALTGGSVVRAPGLELPPNLKSIGNSAFYGCSALQSVSLPSSLVSIGNSAFSGSGLTSVSLPNGLTDLGSSVFRDCTALTTVALSSDIQIIPDYMFSGCTVLNSINFPSGLESIGNSAFARCSFSSLTIPAGLRALGSAPFDYCTGLKSITFKGNAPTVAGGSLGTNLGVDVNGGYVSLYYSGATGFTNPWAGYPAREINIAAFTVSADGTLTNFNPTLYNSNNVEIPSQINGIQIKTIGVSAFTNCANITAVEIPEGVTVIDSNSNNMSGAFTGCTSLESVSIPNSVTNIGSYAFKDCTSLKTIALPDNLNIIEPYTFANCSNLSAITLPNSLHLIGQGAFQSCSSLTSVQIPASVTDIANDAFTACTGLVSINIPNGITTIESQTFFYCTALERITLPLSVTQIQNNAFTGCDKLTITYAGTIADWASLDKGNIPSNITVICSDGTYGAENGASLASVMSLDESVLITFNANGGETPITDAQTDDDGMLSAYPLPTREGYDFTGWYSEPEGGIKADDNTVFAENTMLYAHWTKQEVQNVLPGTSEEDETLLQDKQNTAETENSSEELADFNETEQTENAQAADCVLLEEEPGNETLTVSETDDSINESEEAENAAEQPHSQELSEAESLADSVSEEENILLSAYGYEIRRGNTLSSFAEKVLSVWNKELSRM